MTFLLWRNHNDYEHTPRKITVNELNRSLLNLYPFLHLFHPHHQFLFQALPKTPLMLMREPGNPPSRSEMTLNQLPGTAMTWVMRSSLFKDGLALQLSTTGRVGSIGVLWNDVEIVDQQATVHGGAGRGWPMTQRQGFGIPTNPERFDLEQGQCYDTIYSSLFSHMIIHLFPFNMHRLPFQHA